MKVMPYLAGFFMFLYIFANQDNAVVVVDFGVFIYAPVL